MQKMKKILFLCLVFLIMWSLSGCSVYEKVRYELSGAGIERWENAAIESGVAPCAEEYYYEHLAEELKEAYREIYVHIMQNEDSGTFLTSIGVEEFWDVYYAVLADHPEIFWIGISAQVEESTLTRRVTAYSFEASVPVEERPSMRAALETAADEIIRGIAEDASEYEKVSYVYRYLIQTVDYGDGSIDSQNIQSALLEHTSVCAGYSKAFQYILNRMGIFCTYITGTIKDGGDHGWNMIRLQDQYYYVDVTWGDPVFANGIEPGSNVGSAINYNYLCCTEMDLFKTHTPGNAIELPACISDDYNYYRRNGFYYDVFDRDIIYQALMNSVWNGEEYIVMKFGNQEAFDMACYELFQNGLLSDPGQYLMDLYGVKSWNYRYHTEENFGLITIYW